MKPALILLAFLIPQARGQSSAAPSQAESGVIEGQVVNTAGEPLPKAALHLRSSSAGGANYTVSTDAQGRFTFEAIKPGRYELSGDRGGYLQQFYGDRTPLRCCGEDVVLPPAGHLENLFVTLTPQAAISGRILDEDGDPIAGIMVSAFRIGYSGGQKGASAQGSLGTSNPDGTYTIWNLPPGRYYISAADQRKKTTSDEQPAGKTRALSHLTTYFPNTTEESGATPIVVPAGADVRGIDIRLIQGQTFGIRGRVTGFAGGFQTFYLGLKDSPGQKQRPSLLRSDGTFIFAEVPPGDYILRAQTSLTNQAALTAYLEIAVTDRDLEVEVPLTPATEITGTVSILQNEIPAAMARQTVVVLGDLESPGLTLSSQTAYGSGAFRIVGIVAKRYRVGVAGLPLGVLVKSIRFEGRDVTHDFLDLTSGAGGNLEILLSPTAADLAGVVHNDDGAVTAGATVSIWKPGNTPGEFFDLPSEVRADASGQFHFQNLSPGEYLIGAWEDLEPGLAQVPEFRSAFESSAVKMKLDESGHASFDVKVFSQSSVASALAKLP